MGSFKEFLEDYEAKEKEKTLEFDLKLSFEKLSEEDCFPPYERFAKLRHPVALYNPAIGFPERYHKVGDSRRGSVWGVIPFYGSTVVKLVPTSNRTMFDEEYGIHVGFTSTQIDKIVSFVKETGRLQFMLGSYPTEFKNLEFLEPIFRELKPPVGTRLTTTHLFGVEKSFKYFSEYDALAELTLRPYLHEVFWKNYRSLLGITLSTRVEKTIYNTYAIIRHFFGEEVSDEIGSLMITDPKEAYNALITLYTLVGLPLFDNFRYIHTYSMEKLVHDGKALKSAGIDVSTPKVSVLYEIGKFILEKMVHYPETFDGCMNVIQEYDDHKLYKVLGALNEGIKSSRIDIIKEKRENLSEILDNVWKDNKIRFRSEAMSTGVSACFGLIGELATGMLGTGILAMLGFQVADKIIGLKSDSISERIAKYVSPDYLVAIYDFKKRFDL